MRLISLLFLFGILSGSFVFAQEQTQTKLQGGFVDLNQYYDTRDFSELTINTFAKLSDRFEYFSFINYTGTQSNTDASTYFAEHNLRWAFHKKLPFHVTFQTVFRDGPSNDSYRLGLRWLPTETNSVKTILEKLNLNYSVTFFILEVGYATDDPTFVQLEHAYRWNFLKSKVYLAGFADQNFNHTGSKAFTWVTEHQLGILIVKNFYSVAEFRVNEFRSDPIGIGFGLEYVIRF